MIDWLLRRLIASFFDWRSLDRRTRIHRFLLIVCLSLTYIVGSIYRFCAWAHGLRHFGLADVWPNLWAVPTLTFAWSGFLGRGREETPTAIAGATIGIVLYEFLQMTGFLGVVFDWKDIMATLIGTLIALAVHWGVERTLEADRSP